MRAAATAVRLQLAVLRTSPGDLLALTTVPLLTAIFLAITRHAGRGDLAGYAVLAPAVMAILATAITTSGEIIEIDRRSGVLELLLASPTALAMVVSARVTTVTAVSLLAVGESWLVALALGTKVPIAHPLIFLATLSVTAMAMSGTAAVMAALFVLSRSARAYQNSLTYPLYLLGGALVPVALLPGWLRPLALPNFLAWATDLLRDSLDPDPVRTAPARLAVVLTLGVTGYAVGHLLVRRVAERLRRTGSAGWA
ncbi:ABC-2 type transport system permease protein [Micromonospora sediminicola]|uniref:ABC-2 type transport system permease protein n=1 Tax=Micromonospora sediminicola TaxID=946078 RepID=A0A1A9B443_9ACTN|nr:MULTISPECIES: ABC transporter permease [Micromonospora]PGH41752.1 ABC transporter permease [Micromonospora sp. WMMA1996]SBT63682.1 ABC-2 type transport system permease protein [Micromonospora sediminicola]